MQLDHAMKNTLAALINVHLIHVILLDAFQDNRCLINGSVLCCTGYYEVNDSCIECFGAIGFACSAPCEKGFYGYRCKSKCHCKNNEVCNRYVGCIPIDENDPDRPHSLLMMMIGFGLAIITLSCVFAFGMFYRWRKSLQKSCQPLETTKGFQVSSSCSPEKPETLVENYDEVRESRMLVDCQEGGTRETGEYRINSTDYNLLFGSANIHKKSMTGRYQRYNTIDARFGKKTFIKMTEFPEDDCYVSLSQNEKLSNRLSKSCGDLRVDNSENPYSNNQ